MEHPNDVWRFRALPLQVIIVSERDQSRSHIVAMVKQTALVGAMILRACRSGKESALCQPLSDVLRKQMQSRCHVIAKNANTIFNAAKVCFMVRFFIHRHSPLSIIAFLFSKFAELDKSRKLETAKTGSMIITFVLILYLDNTTD